VVNNNLNILTYVYYKDMEDILTKLLNGHSELSNKILNYKKQIELDEAKLYHINNNNIIDNSVDILKKKINSIIRYPYKLRIFSLDDLYHDDIYTNRFGIILSDIEQLYYLDLIFNNKVNPVIITKEYVYYEYDGYLIQYIQTNETCDIENIKI